MIREPVRVRALPGDDSLVVVPDAAAARIEWRGAGHAILAQAPDEGGPAAWVRTRLVVGPGRRPAGGGRLVREVLIDGWLVVVELEAERRAALRARARRAELDAQARGATHAATHAATRAATDVRADLPGRIASLFVAPGDAVTAGQPLLVIEAMKMLNELRAPRDGIVEWVGVAAGQGIELGDLLVRLQ